MDGMTTTKWIFANMSVTWLGSYGAEVFSCPPQLEQQWAGALLDILDVHTSSFRCCQIQPWIAIWDERFFNACPDKIHYIFGKSLFSSRYLRVCWNLQRGFLTTLLVASFSKTHSLKFWVMKPFFEFIFSKFWEFERAWCRVKVSSREWSIGAVTLTWFAEKSGMDHFYWVSIDIPPIFTSVHCGESWRTPVTKWRREYALLLQFSQTQLNYGTSRHTAAAQWKTEGRLLSWTGSGMHSELDLSVVWCMPWSILCTKNDRHFETFSLSILGEMATSCLEF